MTARGGARRRIRLLGPGPRTRGGIAQFNTQLARVLESSNSEVAVVAFRRVYPRFSRAGQQPPDPSERREDVEYRSILVPWLPWTWLRASRNARLAAGDLLVVQWWHPITAGCSWYLARRARRTGARVVFVCHNAAPHERFPLSRALTRLALNQASSLIALSDQVATELADLAPRIPVQVLPLPPVDVLRPDEEAEAAGVASWRTRLSLDPGSKVVLFFGNVRPYKGLADLIEAFPAVHDRTGATLVVVGTFFEPLSAHRDRVEQLGITDCVRLVDDYVPNEDVAPLFTLADVVALPYRSASQSGVLPVAAAVGRPVVATTVGGLPEALAETGLLVPPRNPTALAEALEHALEHPPAPPPLHADPWRKWTETLAD